MENQAPVHAVVVERNDQSWHCVSRGGEFLRAEKSSDGIHIIIGFNGMTEDCEHGIELAVELAASLAHWMAE